MATTAAGFEFLTALSAEAAPTLWVTPVPGAQAASGSIEARTAAIGGAPGWVLAGLTLLFAVALMRRPPLPVVRLFGNAPDAPAGARRAARLGDSVSAVHLTLLALAAIGAPPAGRVALPLLILSLPLAVAMPFANASAWRARWWSPAERLFFAGLALAAAILPGLVASLDLFGWLR